MSVLTTVYNAGSYLRPALLSVLGQSYENFELFVIDDGSTDGCMDTIEDLDDPRIRRLRQENAGKSVALNLGQQLVRGVYMTIQDADDFSDPNRLRLQVQALEENPEIAAVFTGYDLMLGSGRCAPFRMPRSVEDCAHLIETMTPPAFDATGMYRVSAVEGLRLAPELRVGQVHDFVLQIGEKYPLMVLGECLYTYRFRWDSSTKRDPQFRNNCIEMVRRRALERRGRPAPPETESPPKWPRRFTNRERDNNLAAVFIESVLDSRAHGDRSLAIRTGVKCLLLHPLDLHYYKSLLYAVLPALVLRAIGKHRSSPYPNQVVPIRDR